MKHKLFIRLSLFIITLLFIGNFGFAQVPAYYSGTNITQTGDNLKTSLATLITTTQTTNLSYTPGVWDALMQTDLDPSNSNNVVLIYGYDDTDTDITNDRTRGVNNNGGNVGDWNREHTFPRSLGNPNLGSTGPGSDAHHLRASDVQFNGLRNNHRYTDGSGNAGLIGGNTWYPGDEWKGDVARMMMYMYLRYGNQCLPSAVGTGTQTYHPDMMDIFIEWNAEDPVSQIEINRNVLLEGIQGNRNPFIDNPAFATTIWGGPQAEDRFNVTSTDTEAPTAPSNLVAANTTETETVLSWGAATDNVGVTAYQIFNGTTLSGVVSGTTFTVTGLTPNTAYTFTIKAVDAASNISPNSNAVTITTLEDVVNPPTGDFIVFQGYEGTTSDTWNYTASPVNCNDGGNDVWDIVSSIGSINAANTDSNFFGIRDLEGNCGTASGGTLTFDAVDVSGFNDVSLSFAINVVGYDVANGDTISYEIFHDEVSQGSQDITVGSPYSTVGWEQIMASIPNTVNSVRFILFVKQNGGSDYAGFDDIKLVGTAISTPTPSVIINEVDADTASTDTMEFVELYDSGAGNTALDGMVLVFYNGSNNQSYAAYDLDGFTTDANGYFVIGNTDVPNVSIVIPSNGLQNGADAVALYTGDATDFPNSSVISTDNIVDAFVYDTNDSDDIELLVLLNAGEAQVNEDGAGNKDNHSSQRVPNGDGGSRNTATYTQLAPTPGTQNGAIIVVPPPTAAILINELDADTAGTDTMEFVELFDGGTGNTALDGMVLVFYNGSNNQSYATYDLDGFTTDANGYFVIGNTDVPNVSIVIPSNGLQNGADAVALYTGDATDFPNNSAISITNLIDALVYDTNDSDDAELLVLLNAGEAQINEDGAGDKDAHSLQRFANGSGDALSTSTYVQAIPTPGTSNTNATEPITLIINEVDADTAGTDTMEFVELFDGGTGNTTLDGFVLVFYNGSNNQSYAAYDLDGFTTNAEGYFVIGNTDVPNVSIVIPGNGLQNGADAVALYTGDATNFPNNSAISTTNLIDAIVYDTNDNDDVELLVLLNTGEAQINEDELGNKDGHSLQRTPNGAGGFRNTTTYLQAIPTPGTENGAIIPPPATISISDARNAADGDLVTVSGVLTVADEFSGSAYLQDTTGAIAIFDELVHGDGVFTVGDSITVTGTKNAFNEQIQIGTVTNVENNGTPNQAITPLTITLSELMNHPAELVRIFNPSFPKPGDILFGNSNYELTDASGMGSLRIDNDVDAIVGLGQPETCTEITGVIGRFFSNYQLLPRSGADMSCAGEYVPPTIPVQIPKDKTFDVVTWNIEWFGDETNSPAAGNPMSDVIQKDSAKAVITELNADIYAVEEISDDVLFAQMVNELPGYDYILSPAVSRPNDPGVKQKVGFIYNTATVNVVDTKVLLESIHPLYNGGDDSALVNYPSTTDRFYATGRLPFLMTADVTIDGQTEQINVVALHARANSGTAAQNRYDMRKYDVEVLKDTLDVQYANSKLILLGDYNDDVDETVADITTTTISSYEAYTADTTNYSIVSRTLSDEGFRSFVFRENMIDHIAITNELDESYIDQSVRVHYEFYDSDYPSTTSDHFPVSARFQLKGLEVISVLSTDVTCSNSADGMATIALEGGVAPYSYEWSNGQTTEMAINLVEGTYNVIVRDAIGNEITEDFTIVAPEAISITTTADSKVYLGYGAESCTTLSVTIEGGLAPYTYSWNTGETTQELEVCPEDSSIYTVTVIDANGCSETADINVDVIDVRCGRNPNKQKVQICYRGRTFCLSQRLAKVYTTYGATLGSCHDTNQVSITNLNLHPNPVRNNLNLKLNSSIETDVNISIYNFYGRKVFYNQEFLNQGQSKFSYNLSNLRRGIYYLKVIVNGQVQKVRPIIKL